MLEEQLIEKVRKNLNDVTGLEENTRIRLSRGEISSREAEAITNMAAECRRAFEAEIEALKGYHQPVEMYWPDTKTVTALRNLYPEGSRVRLIEVKDPYKDIPEGTHGTVKHVDDAGTIHVAWDKGGVLGMVRLIDEIEKVYRTEVCLTLEEDVTIFVEAPPFPDMGELEEASLEKYGDGSYSTNSFEVKEIWHQGLSDVG